MKSLYFAPVQGHTDAAYRHFHHNVYGSDLTYYTPFIRLEKDGVRPRDLKDLNSDLNDGIKLVPQIIFRNKEELNSLIDILKVNGVTEIDLNMGCPFPLQTGHGRGAATIANEELAQNVKAAVEANEDINFSVKMRLGLNVPDEWQSLLPVLNTVNLKHIALHPRVAKQQYGGEINLSQFEKFLSESKNPVVFNGDLITPAKMKETYEKYPKIEGLMVARGALRRPSIFSEFTEGKEWPKEKRLEKMLEFHRLLFHHYSQVLCGDAQILSKIRPFWEYAEEEIGRKAWKLIKKATNMAKYQTAVATIE